MATEDYVIVGEAIDIDTLFRIRDQLVTYAYEDMRSRNLIPAGPLPEIDWTKTDKGTFNYEFRWKVVLLGSKP